MADPEFESSDGLAATVLVAALIEELMDNGRLGTAGKKRILDAALMQLDQMDTGQSAAAADIVIAVFGLEGRTKRSGE